MRKPSQEAPSAEDSDDAFPPREYPVAAILGARQVGKTTLARQIASNRRGRTTFFDLEDPRDLAQLGEPTLVLEPLRGLVVLDEIQRRLGFIRTFIERDLPRLGVTIAGETIERFWTMLAHYHGQTWNASALGSSLGVSHSTVRRYLDLLCSTYVIRILKPWSENVGKRVVKSPKIYIADSGLFHALMELETQRDLERHPKLGTSWEGFLVDQVVRRTRARPEECYFWGTHGGAELDLLIVRGRKRLGYEMKRTDRPAVTASMRSAMETLKLDRLTIVHAGESSFDLGRHVRATAAAQLLEEITPLRAD